MSCWRAINLVAVTFSIIVEPQKRAPIDTLLCFSVSQSVSQSVTKPIFGFTYYNILLFSTHYNFLGLLDDFATLLKFFAHFLQFFAIFCKLAKTLFFGYFWLLLVTSCNSGFFLSIFAICFATFCKILQFLSFFEPQKGLL